MATGDQSDFFQRLSDRMPKGWFGSIHPLVDAVLNGVAIVFAGVYASYLYMVQQTRLQTSTDGWIDLSAADYFGANGLLRITNEQDPAYRNRIKINIIRERGTRNAVIKVLTDLTGRAPVIIEPMRPLDTGAYRGPYLGYGVAGSYGSMAMAYQAFVRAYRPAGSGIPLVAGYGVSVGGYDQPSRAEYASYSSLTTGVTDAMIYAAIDSVKPYGTTIWTAISN